ncbi:hypothetical protein D3C71_1810550 [compost metagenome]
MIGSRQAIHRSVRSYVSDWINRCSPSLRRTTNLRSNVSANDNCESSYKTMKVIARGCDKWWPAYSKCSRSVPARCYRWRINTNTPERRWNTTGRSN